MSQQRVALKLLAAVAFVFAATAMLRETNARQPPPWVGGPYGRLGIAMVDGRPDLSDVFITLERTGCMGSCPDYVITLQGAGGAVYEGRRLVTTMGKWQYDLPANAMLPILERLQRFDFMNREHQCRWLASDTPHYTLSLRVGNRKQSFLDYTGGTSWDVDAEHTALHASMTSVMNLVDKIASIEHWIGSEEARKALYEEQQRLERDANKRKAKARGQ